MALNSLGFVDDLKGARVIDLVEEVNATLVTTALKLGVEPLVDDHLGELGAHDAGAKSEHVGIVVHAGELGAEGLGAHDGAYALDRMYADIPAALLQTELDTCWVNVAGESPVAYLNKYAGRAPVVHLKDFVMPGKKPAHMYELIGVDDDGAPGEDEVFEFRPVGYGAQDFPAIIAAAAAAGAKWVVVEQDQPSLGKTPLECAALSIAYVNSLQ